jgi:hypothetical protein
LNLGPRAHEGRRSEQLDLEVDVMSALSKVTSGLAMVALVTVLVFVGSASAADPVVVRVPACAFNGGTASVTAGAPSDQWSAPAELSKGPWVTKQPDEALPALRPGQSVALVYDVRFSHPVAVLYPPVDPTGGNGPFVTVEDGPYTCASSAVAP